MKTYTLWKINDFTQKNIIQWFNLNPEFCHDIAMLISKNLEKTQWILDQIKEACYLEGEENLKINISGLELKNPVGLAAWFVKSPFGLKFWEAFWFGFISIWWITEYPQPWNKKQRIFRTSSQDIVNGMGLPWNGLYETVSMLAERKYKWEYPQIPIWANLCNSSITKPENKIEEFKNQILALYPYVDYFEINISCPNQAGICLLGEQLENILKELSNYNDFVAYSFWKKNKLFVKISPLSINHNDPKDGSIEWLKTIAEICNIYSDDQIHWVIATNTAKEHKYIDKTQIQTPSWDIITWWASGKQIQERSKKTVYELRKVLNKKIPIIWVWGIWYDEVGEEWKSAIQMLDSGASSLQIYSSFVQKSVLVVRQSKNAILNINNN